MTQHHRSCKIMFLLAVLIIPITGCPGTNPPVINLPPAETPLLETILDFDNNLLAPFHAAGVFEMQPGRRFELRLRAVWPSELRVKIENRSLPEVKDTASHPELDSSGYYRISDVRPIHTSDPRFFWRVFVVLPLDKRGNVNFAMTVHDISQNQNLSGTDKEALPLQITVVRTPIPSPRPSSVFFAGLDAKHTKTGPDHAFIADNVTLAGWLVGAPHRNADGGTEDWHYNIWLDNDFIERNYSATTQPLAPATIPGRWYTWGDNVIHPYIPIPLTGGSQPNASTFLLPGLDIMNVELSAWHKSRHKNQVPSGWVPDPELGDWPDVFWPFTVMKPFGIAANEPELQEGDYVIITGALVEDSAHLHLAGDETPDAEYWRHKCWFDTYTGHGGWLEIHPLDSIRRVPKSQEPTVRITPRVFQVCRKDFGSTPLSKDVYLVPIPSAPPSANSVLRFREIIDERFTDMSTIDQHIVEISPYEPAALHVFVSVKTLNGRDEGHFKAVYLLWWEEGNTPRPTAVPQPTGVPTPQLLDLSVCSKKPYLPQCDPGP